MNVFELEAVIQLADDKYKQDLKSAESETKAAGGKIGNALKTIGKVGAAALGAAAAATVALTKKVVQAYGEYEQLVGGVDKLYGEASEQVQKYAQDAYKTVGISANQYMQTATSFSAALINSLNGDVQKAAEMTDVAMRSMSDNWNTFGTDIESVQNAYQGFAKQNYTMLDNLKLGYAGSKEGMQQLIADANAYGKTIGMTSELSIDSFADIVQAIDLVQQKQRIAGTTAKEASTTIEGSINTMKGAWDNFLVSLGGGGDDVGKALDKVIDSFDTVVGNIIPVVQKVADALPKAIAQMAKRLPAIIKSILPAFSKAFLSLFSGLVDNLGEILDVVLDIALELVEYLIDNLPQVIDKVFVAVEKIAEAIASKLPELVPKLVMAIIKIVPSIISGVANTILAGISGLIQGITGEIDVFGLEASRQLQEMNDRIANTVKSWDDLKGAQDEAVKAANNEASQYQGLIDELGMIVDENGHVKKGMEDRAAFINGQLSEALGYEVLQNGELVKSYQDIRAEVEQLIAQKRAEALLNAQEDMYNEALDKRRQLYDDIKAKEAEVKKVRDQLADPSKLTDTGRAYLEEYAQGLESTLGEMQTTYDEYYTTIASYEQNYADFQQGNYDKIASSLDAYGNALSSNLATRKTQLADSIAYETEIMNKNKTLYEQTGNAIYENQVKHSEAQIKVWEDELKTTNEMIVNHNKDVTARDKAFAEDRYASGKIATEKWGGGMSDAFGGVESTLKKDAEAAGDAGDEAMKSAQNPTDIIQQYEAGFEGMSWYLNQKLWDIGYRAGKNLDDGARSGAGVHSPSVKAMQIVKYYTQGAVMQMDKSLRTLYNSARKMGEAINDGVDDVLSDSDLIDGDLGFDSEVTTETITSPETDAIMNLSSRMDEMEDMMYNAFNRVLADGVDLRWNDRELTRLVKDHA